MATTKKPAATAAVKKVPAVNAKSAVKSVAAKPVAAKTAAPAAPVVKAKAPARKKVASSAKAIDAGQRANYIEVAAFYIAERRGFAPGDAQQDYLAAAAEIDRLIADGHFGL